MEDPDKAQPSGENDECTGGKSEICPPEKSNSSDPMEDPDKAQPSGENDECTGGKSEICPPEKSNSSDPMEDPDKAQPSGKNDECTGGKSEICPPEKSNSCNLVNAPGHAEHSGKDHNKQVGEESGDIHTEMSGNRDQQEEEISGRTIRMKQYERDTETLRHRLHLPDKHQQKLTPADFLKIGPPVKEDQNTSEKDLARTFLQRLMMLDYRARYIPDIPHVSHSNPAPQDEDEADESDLDALYSTSVDTSQSRPTHVHPMDVQMTVFHCSDNFLRQIMMTKLSQCQYALPLLVPDPVTMDIQCPLWTFRQITKTWKKTTETKAKSMPICQAETHMVSFLRLGSLSLSKSQLINTLINDRHNTFFHRNCAGSTKTRHLMEGVAEIAWYYPDGKSNDAFTDCIAFCNLHGDALLFEEQRGVLIEKSSVNVILLPTLERGDNSAKVVATLFMSEKPLICLIVNEDCDSTEIKKGKYKIGLKDKSQLEVSQELKRVIRKLLSGSHVTFQLQSMAEVTGIRVDEGEQACQNGKSAAKEIGNLFQGMDISKIKERFLPCQGKLWQEWSKTKKEMYHLKGNLENDKCEKEKRLTQIREEQCSASHGELMKLFIDRLSSLNSPEKEYFLKWTQILIDAISTDDLSLILQSYDEKWSEKLALKREHDKSDQLKKKEIELNQISAKFQSATFGMEHILRELAQIYEAHVTLGKKTNWKRSHWARYPELAAELMISGHPMELLDGDAGHVPLTWIASLLDHVVRKLGDKKVFVLSVLGLQSSGKSTLLNAMFGLQFAVSSGRCTRGAFMQLVKVSEENRKDLTFDYVLVVDTEGLRALELEGSATLQHDNQLATFVVGLGSMTLINIFGENPAEMQDVLQIVVQAFMRMKKVKLSPGCVFVHQNVTDIAAEEKMMDGKRRLQEKLDQMTQIAAKEEFFHAECFSDVIAFDVQKDVKYFAQLWEGSPPMAPPNPGYSECVQDLKNFIFSKASMSAGTTLSEFKSAIKDLWNALLSENFVFTFKNTLEIAVFRKLECEYWSWTWALRSRMSTIENQLQTRIQNGGLDNIELGDLHEEMNKTYEKLKEDVKSYFEDNRDKEMLLQWHERFKIKIEVFYQELVTGVKIKLDEVIQQKKACKKLDDKKEKFESYLLQKSKEHAREMKGKENDEVELEKQFNSLWSDWVRELTTDTKPIQDINLKRDESNILAECSFEWSLIEESKSSGRYKNISTTGTYDDYMTLKTSRFTSIVLKISKSKNLLPYEQQELIRTFINGVEKDSLEGIKDKPLATKGYSLTYLQELAQNVQTEVRRFEAARREYTLKKEFTVDLLLYVFDGARTFLSEAHKKFKMNNDALTYLEGKKMQYYNAFRGYCKGSSSAVVLGELICDKLRSSASETVCNQTATGLAQEMRCTLPAFSGNRRNLEKHVLKSLAEAEDFDGSIAYIKKPKMQVETFIKQEVKEYIFIKHEEKALNILRKNVRDIDKSVRQALSDATENVKTNEGDIKMWLKGFSTLLKDQMTFATISPTNFTDINNFEFLKDEIEKGLVPLMKEISSLSLMKMWEFRLQPDQILIDQLCNCCWEKCPFCSAVCTNTMKDHKPDKHQVPFHRPAAIKGMHIRGTDEFVINFCTTSVASNRCFYITHDSEEKCPYKTYQKAGERYAAWDITADESKLTYWKWFVCRYQQQLEKYYELKFHKAGDIPPDWSRHTKEEAIESLDEI